MSKRPFDYCYNPDDWEVTYGFEETNILEEDLDVGLGDVALVGTLVKGPNQYLAAVVTAFDDDGQPDEWEVRWFATEEEAKVAVAAQKSPTP